MAAQIATRRMTRNEYSAPPRDGTRIEGAAGEAIFAVVAPAPRQQVAQLMHMPLQPFTHLRRTGRVFRVPCAMMARLRGPARAPERG